MNTANLQLEGRLMAVASLNRLFVDKEPVSAADIDSALRVAETSIANNGHGAEEISPANRDAICFPVRVLQLANAAPANEDLPRFSELTKTIGRTKPD